MPETRPAGADGAVPRKLDRAVRTGHLVRLHRSLPGADPVEGFVVATNPAWTLLAPCRDVLLDGFTAVRTPDVARVKRVGDEGSLTVRALRRRGQWPVQEPGVSCGDLRELLVAASARYGLVVLEFEHRDPGASWIGSVLGLGRRTVRLREVDTRARWHDGPSKFRLAEITRVSFAGRYDQALLEFAGPRPAGPES
ncbi:hypothetical protein [Kitasatospora phosalacinea]|uniref:Uncharacterized protein n=1 Tax=Kitasatospora phosalacinea TaxID=2065 RepID=A0A9W6ULJ6_9ACTN|nr:hypothetical protein [Kitasatospora phosalacinea]GLW54491.1 hypothetical protein Kpho01_25020 [Kitasatospora phosalacinea]